MRISTILPAMLLTIMASQPLTAAHARPYEEGWSYRQPDEYDAHDRGDDDHGYDSGWRDGYDNGYHDSYAEDDRDWRDRRHYNDDDYRCPHGSRSGGTALGAIGGGVLGHVIAPRRKKLLGTILGGVAGGVVGNQIASAKSRC